MALDDWRTTLEEIRKMDEREKEDQNRTEAETMRARSRFEEVIEARKKKSIDTARPFLLEVTKVFPNSQVHENILSHDEEYDLVLAMDDDELCLEMKEYPFDNEFFDTIYLSYITGGQKLFIRDKNEITRDLSDLKFVIESFIWKHLDKDRYLDRMDKATKK